MRAEAVVVAAGSLNTPQLLMRSGLEQRAIGKHLGLHPVRLVYGLFDEPQDAHMVYPITAHCMDRQHDEDGGFVVEATTIQDPIAFATTLCDENGPLWGQRLVEAVHRFRHWVGLLALVNDENNAVGRRRRERRASGSTSTSSRPSSSGSTRRFSSAARCSRPRARSRSAGPGSPRRTCRAAAGWATTRSARPSTGTASRTSVKRLFVGDGSLVPRTLSVNPSLTIMALATRLAEHLDADPNGYLAA